MCRYAFAKSRRNHRIEWIASLQQIPEIRAQLVEEDLSKLYKKALFATKRSLERDFWQADSIMAYSQDKIIRILANHALQRTAPAVTLAAPPPSPAQPSRQPPPSLSLGSLHYSSASAYEAREIAIGTRLDRFPCRRTIETKVCFVGHSRGTPYRH